MASASRLICCTGLDCSSEANSSTSRCLSSREISSRFRAVSASACSSCARSSSVASPMSSSGWAASSAASSSVKLTVSFSSAPSGPSCLTDADSSSAVAGTAGASATAVRPPAFGYVLHIFGLADMFLGNRDVGFLGSHLQGFYSLLCPALFRQPTKSTSFLQKIPRRSGESAEGLHFSVICRRQAASVQIFPQARPATRFFSLHLHLRN